MQPEVARLLTIDVQSMGAMTARGVTRLVQSRLRRHDTALESTHIHAEDGLAGLNPEDYSLVWLYASNVIQVTGPAELMAFLRRFTEAGVRVVAIYAWEPEALKLEEIKQLGVHLAPWPLEPSVLIELFGIGEDAPDALR